MTKHKAKHLWVQIANGTIRESHVFMLRENRFLSLSLSTLEIWMNNGIRVEQGYLYCVCDCLNNNNTSAKYELSLFQLPNSTFQLRRQTDWNFLQFQKIEFFLLLLKLCQVVRLREHVAAKCSTTSLALFQVGTRLLEHFLGSKIFCLQMVQKHVS